jgi:hypothetical protein
MIFKTRVESRGIKPQAPDKPRKTNGGLLTRRWRRLAAICGAAALSFAGVLSLATIVARLATAFALTGVLALAGVLVFLTGILLKRNASFCADIRGMRLHCKRAAH